MKDYKNYKRIPIQLSEQNIMLIHLFSDNSMEQTFENLDWREENQAVMNHDAQVLAAEQFFLQLEGHYCDAFLEAMIIQATKRLNESDKSLNKMEHNLGKSDIFTRAQDALDEAKKEIK